MDIAQGTIRAVIIVFNESSKILSMAGAGSLRSSAAASPVDEEMFALL